MTCEEAIKEIENMLIVAEHDCDGIKPEYEERNLEALKMAYKALQKQVPMKPKVSRGKFTKWYNCSACKGWLKGNEKFCDCGQRIDWSDVNDIY